MHFENKPKASARETSERAEQDAREKTNVGTFCAAASRASETLEPKIKEYLEAHVRKEIGQWRQCDGKVVIFDGFSRDDAHRQILVHFLVHEIDKDGNPIRVEVTDEIPMPERMSS
jgi:hypothetical protein